MNEICYPFYSNLSQYWRCFPRQIAKGVDSCNGTRFHIRWKINILFNHAKPSCICTSIFDLMRTSHTIWRSSIRYLSVMYCIFVWPLCIWFQVLHIRVWPPDHHQCLLCRLQARPGRTLLLSSLLGWNHPQDVRTRVSSILRKLLEYVSNL